MRCARPETRERAVEAIRRAMFEAKEHPTRYGLVGDEARNEYQAGQVRRIKTIRYCG